MKPHQNLFFYYAGSSKAVDGRDRQLEDNTTKAIVNLLELSARSDPEQRLLNRFFEWIGVQNDELSTVGFALQLSTIGKRRLAKASNKILLGIAPRLIDTEEATDSEEKRSRPDAWMWTDKSVVCIENKVVGTFGQAQLKAHMRELGQGAVQDLRTWREIYAFFADAMASMKAEDADAPTMVLLGQFLEYLRIIAYRQEIDMGEFDGFRPEHFSAFTYLDDEDAEDNRRQVKHYLGQFLDAVHEELPVPLKSFGRKHLGNIRSEDRSAWATLSQTEKMVHEPHYSFMIDGSSVCVRLLIEGSRPTRRAKKMIESNRNEFLKLLSQLRDFEIQLNRRWQVQAQIFDAKSTCSIMLDCVAPADVDYLVAKMNELEKPETQRGYFMIMIDRRFPFDLPEVRTKAFARTAAQVVENLTPIRLFLEGGAL